MFRKSHLLFLTLLLILIVLNKVHAHYDNDYDDNDYQDTSYGEHYEGDGCSEEYEDPEDIEDITKLLIQKGMAPKGISPMAGTGLILPTVLSDICTNKWIMDSALRRFNAFFFGDYNTPLIGVVSDGPVAVKGNMNTSSIVANAAGDSMDCSVHGTLDVYGLVVGGSINLGDKSDVYGDSLINGGGTLSQITEKVAGCYATDKEGNGVVDFDAVEAEANRLSGLYQKHPPTLQLSDDGSLKRLTADDEGVEYLTFNSCDDRSSCAKIWEGQMSVADDIFFDRTQWEGILGDLKPDTTKTFVFNIPVIENTNITISSFRPTKGFNICKLLLNFYPVESVSGAYNPTGVFNLIRQIRMELDGLMLAPRGNIIDNASGYYAGQIVGKSYIYDDSKFSHYFNNYKANSGTCDYFDGCIPEAKPTCTPETSTSTSFTTITASPDTISTLTQTETITKGGETITQRSTVTTNIGGTQIITSTATSTFYHIHDENCDEEEEEEDSYWKK